MRKKLLALLMCATMVLGTSATAFAVPSNDDWTNAEKIYSNSENFYNELFKEQTNKVTTTVYVKSVNSNVTYGFDSSTLAAVKLNSDNKALTYLGVAGEDYEDFSAKVTSSLVDVGGVSYVNPSQALAGYATPDDAPTTVVLGYKLADNVTRYALATKADGQDYAKNAEGKVTRYAIKTDLGTSSKSLVSADGWLDVVDTSVTLFTADTKNITGTGIVAFKYSKVSKDDVADVKATLAKALENGVLTSSAIAVKLDAYAISGDKDAKVGADNWLKLVSVQTPVAGYTITSSTDLLSRTSLKDAVNIFNLNTEVASTDYEMGATIYQIATLASDVDVTGSKFTFTIPFTGESNVIIFDQAEAQSNNDGVASETTTTAASQTAASSPKTGDVAPIAALAVVMMGACGAMVVASKKRA